MAECYRLSPPLICLSICLLHNMVSNWRAETLPDPFLIPSSLWMFVELSEMRTFRAWSAEFCTWLVINISHFQCLRFAREHANAFSGLSDLICSNCINSMIITILLMRRMRIKRKHVISEDLSYLSKRNWAYTFDLNIILLQEGRKWKCIRKEESRKNEFSVTCEWSQILLRCTNEVTCLNFKQKSYKSW